MSSLVKSVKDFLEDHFIPGKGILLGFSGGGDSLALLDLLFECRNFFSLEIHLAHVDHKWREESTRQAEDLKRHAAERGLPFHLHTVVSSEKSEEEAREQRLQFFLTLYRKLHVQALVLAHHGDDQAETVLKRIFEGASLTSLGAMSKVSTYQNMVVWRPLLDISKNLLSDWIDKRGQVAIQDSTNSNTQFLRARMRQNIFPTLSKQFGKEITPALNRLGKTAHELHHYFERKILPIYCAGTGGPFGIYWDLNPFFPLERIEIQFLLKKIFSEQGEQLSHNAMELMIDLLETKAANRKIGKSVVVDRGIVFFFQKKPPVFSFERHILKEHTTFEKDGWVWDFSFTLDGYLKSSWKDLWRGKLSFALEEGEYQVIAPEMQKGFNKWWSNHKVPVFLRHTVPLIEQNGKLIFELLTGKDKVITSKLNLFISIEIKSRD